MQQTGTLKKRRRRNLAKVNGIGTVPYDESEDVFTGRELFSSAVPPVAEINEELRKFCVRSGEDTRLRFSSKGMLDHRRDAGEMFRKGARITRDPVYHDIYDEESGPPDVTSAVEIDAFAGLGPFSNRPYLAESIRMRSHFLDKYSVQRLRQLVLLGKSSGAFPWTWNEKETQIDLWSPFKQKLWTYFWFVSTMQTICISLFQAYTFFHSLAGAKKSYREVFMSSFSLLWYIWAVYFILNLYFYKDETREYINTMLKFNKKYVEKFLIHLDDYKDGGRVVINLSILTNISQVFVSVSLFLVMPHSPWYLTSYIYPKPWYWLIPGAIQQYVVCGQVITSFTLICWIVVVHCNTMQFWLREIHNHNDSDYTINELRSPKISIETYRTLQILNQVFNGAMAPLAIPLTKIHMMTGMVPCGYILIRSMNHLFVEEFPGILSYPIGVLNCATAGFAVMSMAAEVFDLGCSFIDSWSRTKNKDFRRILMSCPTMKVWVGRFYFLTVSTTITFFKVLFDYIIDCIITFP